VRDALPRLIILAAFAVAVAAWRNAMLAGNERRLAAPPSNQV
jgi:hypothetical protein